jgi:transposase InsO family protein
MSRRGNPYDNAKAESFMKTLKVEAVYARSVVRDITDTARVNAGIPLKEYYRSHD